MRLLLLASFLLISGIGQAQHGLFINAAYAWNWNGSSGADVRFLEPPHFGLPPYAWHDRWTESEGSFSTGQGVWAEVGYRFSERLGLSVAGRQIFAPAEHHYTQYLGMFGFPEATIYTRKADNPLFLEPGVKLFFRLGEKAEAHLRAGVLLPLRHSIQASTYTPDTLGGYSWQTASELRTHFSLGGFGGAGITADLGSGLGLFIQGGFGLLSLNARDETVLGLAFVNDRNIVDEMTEAERVVVYERGIDYLQTIGGRTEYPSVKPTYAVPFNYWSVEIGIGWAME